MERNLDKRRRRRRRRKSFCRELRRAIRQERRLANTYERLADRAPSRELFDILNSFRIESLVHSLALKGIAGVFCLSEPTKRRARRPCQCHHRCRYCYDYK